ncbi:hypothetical protein HYH02_014696 [Chlamydomonas schloesseri]|uniref:Uncharacterized protein n=1 Tax=Chlamydomonas schloesseri TaxID=2026947 RepID=A0A835SNK8_9CHLO|nr:hypothetical protein HYH02_014696 [Chlamydomonas schloesseri]|eukprot:KAG2426843.1 hypothetical protein HYH02_014696 [Chlamydomonas schloesseri]
MAAFVCARGAFAQDAATDAALKRLEGAAFKTAASVDEDGWTFVIGNVRFVPPNAKEVGGWQDRVTGHVCDKLLALSQADDCKQVSIANDGYATAFVGVKLLNPKKVLGQLIYLEN